MASKGLCPACELHAQFTIGGHAHPHGLQCCREEAAALIAPVEPLEVEIGEAEVLLPAGNISSMLEGTIVVQVTPLSFLCTRASLHLLHPTDRPKQRQGHGCGMSACGPGPSAVLQVHLCKHPPAATLPGQHR